MNHDNHPQLIYITNACGEYTGNGTIDLTEEEYDKVSFGAGPGILRNYIGEIDGRAFAVAVLPLYYDDPVWPETESFEPKDCVARKAQAVGEEVRCRLKDAFGQGNTHVFVEDGSGYYEVIVAIDLLMLSDEGQTLSVFGNAFGNRDLLYT